MFDGILNARQFFLSVMGSFELEISDISYLSKFVRFLIFVSFT